MLCQTLKVNRSGYYEWLRPTPISSVKDTDSLYVKANKAQKIKDLFSLHRRRYGSRRLVSEMKDRGVKISRDFVRRVLIENQLKPIQPRSFLPRTTTSRHAIGYSS
ncbi:IS3 family transposase [Spirosoma luteolum]